MTGTLPGKDILLENIKKEDSYVTMCDGRSWMNDELTALDMITLLLFCLQLLKCSGQGQLRAMPDEKRLHYFSFAPRYSTSNLKVFIVLSEIDNWFFLKRVTYVYVYAGIQGTHSLTLQSGRQDIYTPPTYNGGVSAKSDDMTA